MLCYINGRKHFYVFKFKVCCLIILKGQLMFKKCIFLLFIQSCRYLWVFWCFSEVLRNTVPVTNNEVQNCLFGAIDSSKQTVLCCFFPEVIIWKTLQSTRWFVIIHNSTQNSAVKVRTHTGKQEDMRLCNCTLHSLPLID